MIADLLSPGVVVAEGDEGSDQPLPPEEARVVRRAVARRRRHFAAGRACARRALSRLGFEEAVIPRGPHNEPIWPAGIVGAITHCEGYCAAAVARRADFGGVGIDAEPRDAVTSELLPSICTVRERQSLEHLSAADPWRTVVFSAKESLFKAIFPIVGRFVEMHEVEMQLDPRSRRFAASFAGDPPQQLRALTMRGRFAWDDERVYTALSLPAVASGAAVDAAR